MARDFIEALKTKPMIHGSRNGVLCGGTYRYDPDWMGYVCDRCKHRNFVTEHFAYECEQRERRETCGE